MEQQKMASKQILSGTPTDLFYVGRSIFKKEVNTRFFWTFELGTQEGINVPIRNIVGFQQKDRQESGILNNDVFYRPSVTSA